MTVSRVSMRLTELPRDMRSREVAFVFEVENHADGALDLVSLTPVINERLTVQEEYKLESALEQRAIDEHIRRFRTLLVDLVTERMGIAETPSATARPSTSPVTDYLAEMIAAVLTLPLEIWHRLVQRVFRTVMPGEDFFTPRHRRKAEEYVPEFDSLETAVSVGRALLAELGIDTTPTAPGSAHGSAGQPTLATSARAAACKLLLQRLEKYKDDHGVQPVPIATVASDQTFRRPFVVEARRRAVWNRSYVITVEAGYRGATEDSGSAVPSANGAATQHRMSAYAVFSISPNPLVVTVFAVLGACVAGAVDKDGAWVGWSRLVPVLVLAAVAFNIVDFTLFGPRLAKQLDWKGALIIGILCGAGGLKVPDLLHFPSGGVAATSGASTPTPTEDPSAARPSNTPVPESLDHTFLSSPTPALPSGGSSPPSPTDVPPVPTPTAFPSAESVVTPSDVFSPQ